MTQRREEIEIETVLRVIAWLLEQPQEGVSDPRSKVSSEEKRRVAKLIAEGWDVIMQEKSET